MRAKKQYFLQLVSMSSSGSCVPTCDLLAYCTCATCQQNISFYHFANGVAMGCHAVSRDPMIDQAAQQPQALDVVLDVTEAQW